MCCGALLSYGNPHVKEMELLIYFRRLILELRGIFLLLDFTKEGVFHRCPAENKPTHFIPASLHCEAKLFQNKHCSVGRTEERNERKGK